MKLTAAVLESKRVFENSYSELIEVAEGTYCVKALSYLLFVVYTSNTQKEPRDGNSIYPRTASVSSACLISKNFASAPAAPSVSTFDNTSSTASF